MSDTEDLKELFEDVTGSKKVITRQRKTGSRMREKEADSRPKTQISCPECTGKRAYYQMKQIRAADESETRFFECVTCGHKWREDDH